MDAELVFMLFSGLPDAEMQLILAELKELYPVALETMRLPGQLVVMETGTGRTDRP